MNETTVTLQGYLGGPVALRQAAGVPVASFRVAATPRRRTRDGDWVDGQTQWYSVTTWRNLAEHCAASLHRGDAVVVHGRLRVSTYVTKAGAEALDLQVEALTVGHDLTRGTTTFTRPVRAEAAPPAEPAVAAVGAA
ncbi:single-stranded DNA-binding protein [Nocardioides litoris]|uniref:single-stranded DNA-binding protein n=1 Tax=Nocardioides litoris TaxID=1926648 RepID=UPI001122D683|nr:single-stranded DNA-binding protein [Nocardioides litoris]